MLLVLGVVGWLVVLISLMRRLGCCWTTILQLLLVTRAQPLRWKSCFDFRFFLKLCVVSVDGRTLSRGVRFWRVKTFLWWKKKDLLHLLRHDNTRFNNADSYHSSVPNLSATSRTSIAFLLSLIHPLPNPLKILQIVTLKFPQTRWRWTSAHYSVC